MLKMTRTLCSVHLSLYLARIKIGVSTFKLGKVLFFNNVIDGFEGAPGNAITKEIYIARYAKANRELNF